jgi:hypothetical protein
MGPYGHVAIYLGKLGTSRTPEIFPAVFESVGRGVLIRDLLPSWIGKHVVVMRLSEENIALYGDGIFFKAIEMASAYGSYYDYPAIIRWAIPRVIMQKLHLPIPQTWKRDERHICSEAVYSCIEKAGLDILPDTEIPLPEDFVLRAHLFNSGETVIDNSTIPGGS